MSTTENQEEEITTEESSSFSPSPSSPSSSSTSSTSTAQSGGGGGWGGWFSSKITQASDYLKPVVNNTLNEYVRPTVTSTIDDYIRPAVDSASHIVRDLQQTWDEDQAAEAKANKGEEEKKEKKEGEEESTEDQEKNENDEREEGAEGDEEVSRVESLLSAMGSSVSTFGTAASFMGSVIQSGITKVQTSTNMDQVKTIANQVVETTKKATHTVVEQVNERKIYEKTIEAGHKTYNTLESVGKKALDILLPGEMEQEGTTTETTTTATPSSAPEKEAKEEEAEEEEEEEAQQFDFNNYFNSCGGSNSLQSLAKSSEESTGLATRKMRKIPVSDRLALDETFGKIREIAEEEEITAQATEEITLGEEYEESQSKSKTITKEANEHIQKLISEFKEAISNGAGADKAVEYSDSILLEGSKKIVELTAASIEQLLCASDLFLEQVKTQEPVNFSEISLEENQNFSRIVFILKLANSVHSDISQLSNSVIAFLREVATIAKDSSESNDGVDKKTSANINTLYLETSSALSHVQDAKKYPFFLF